jgi:hypothetical protein
MKKNFLITILITSILAIYFYFQNPKIIGISKKLSDLMLLADYTKLGNIKRLEGDTINLDYINYNMSISRIKLLTLVDSIYNRNKNNYLLLRYQVDKKFSNFGIVFEGIDINNNPISNINKINISLPSSNPDSLNYKKMHMKLMRKGAFGFQHKYYSGVKYSISATKNWLDSNIVDTYYLYPAVSLEPNSKNFTTIIFSNDSKLRTSISSSITENAFYGDKGTGCCSQ